MVQIYAPDNTNFTTNGDFVLMPTRCELTCELNGVWVLELEHHIDKDGRWKHIVEQAVLKVPTWQGSDQLYRISKVTKTDYSVSAVAYPIFYDSANDCFLLDVRPTAKTGQEALDIITANSPYSGTSNIQTGATAYFVRRNLMSAINGNDSPTFIELWGGEILYDNYNIVINERVGGDYGAQARYGLNIEGVSYDVDTSELVTRIVPVAFNGHTMTGDFVDSQNVNNYPIIYTKEVKYENIRMIQDANGADSNAVICETQAELDAALLAAAQADFATGIDIPKVTMDIDMLAISSQNIKRIDALTDTDDAEVTDQTDDAIFTVFYEAYKTLEDIRLGDTVHCRHYKLDITSDARVINLTYDCLRKKVTHIVLGDYKYNFIKSFDNILTRTEKAINPDGSVIAEQVKGFLDGSQTQLKAQYDIAQRQDILAVLFENFDTQSPMYGALGIGTQGISISKTRTADGKSWEWTTGITANGMNASMGVFGILSDKVGKNYINLNTGAVHIGDQTNYISFDPTTGSLDLRVSSFSLAGSSISDIATPIANSAAASALSSANSYTDSFDASLTQSEVFNRLTNNQQNQGIYLDGTNLYINASAINAGTLSASRIAAGSIDVSKLNVSTLSAISADMGAVTAGSINIGNGAFSVTSSGDLTANNATVTGVLHTNSGSTVGGFNVDTSGMSYGTIGSSGSFYQVPGGYSGSVTVASESRSDWQLGLGSNFGVTTDGSLHATNVTLTGKITATSGYIGTAARGFSIGENAIYNGTSSLTSYTQGIYLGTDGIRVYNGSNAYTNISDGIITAKGADISGQITAKSGYIGNGYNGFTIGNTAIYNGTNSMTSTANGIYLGTDGINLSGNFIVDKYGEAELRDATIYGSFTTASYSSHSIDWDAIVVKDNYVRWMNNGSTYGELSSGGTLASPTMELSSLGNIEIDPGNNYAVILYGKTRLDNVSPDSSATEALYLDASGNIVSKTSSSSIRYKNVLRNMTDADVDKAYNIQPIIGKYKDGILPETDLRYGKSFPMFVAEDVAEYIPDAVDYKNGQIETWNERILIPVMFQMIKNLKKEVEVLKSGKIYSVQ